MSKPNNKENEIPGKNWTWQIKPGQTEGVHTYEGCLTWYTSMKQYWAGGGASQQSFSDFLENGPPVSDVPGHVISQLKEIISKYPEIDE